VRNSDDDDDDDDDNNNNNNNNTNKNNGYAMLDYCKLAQSNFRIKIVIVVVITKRDHTVVISL
jgi:hypothetical protein